MQCNVKVYHVVQTETFGEHQREQRELPMSNKCANHVSNNQTLIQHDSTVNILLQPRYWVYGTSTGESLLKHRCFNCGLPSVEARYICRTVELRWRTIPSSRVGTVHQTPGGSQIYGYTVHQGCVKRSSHKFYRSMLDWARVHILYICVYFARIEPAMHLWYIVPPKEQISRMLLDSSYISNYMTKHWKEMWRWFGGNPPPKMHNSKATRYP